MEDNRSRRDEVFSKRIKAGKRTYFIDVKATRGNDYYITITESKRKDDGFGYAKHKIFLYKEDFGKFVNGLNEVIGHVKTDLMPEYDFDRYNHHDEIEADDELANAVESVRSMAMDFDEEITEPEKQNGTAF